MAEADAGLRPLLEAGAHGLEHCRPLQFPCTSQFVFSNPSLHITVYIEASQAHAAAPTSVLDIVDDQGRQDGDVASRPATDLERHCSIMTSFCQIQTRR
jgi:hypothetical protein